MRKDMGINKVIDAIRKHNRFLILSHINLEGDSTGSQLALYFLLKSMGKESIIINETPIPANLNFLPSIDKIMVCPKFRPEFNRIDAVIVIDAAELSRIGRAVKYIPNGVELINIDHHISNSKFGSINWIKPSASSAGEMVYELCRRLKVPIHQDIALCIYVAIATDTGYFRYFNTTAKVHRIVSQLIDCGVSPGVVNEQLNYRWILKDIKILGRVISTIKTAANGKIAWLCITDKLASSISKESPLLDSEALIHFPRALETSLIAVLFKETKPRGTIKISFRSKGDIDVNRLAGYFGGGGHRRASGCTVKGSLKEIEKMVIEKAKEYLTQSNGSHTRPLQHSKKIS